MQKPVFTAMARRIVMDGIALTDRRDDRIDRKLRGPVRSVETVGAPMMTGMASSKDLPRTRLVHFNDVGQATLIREYEAGRVVREIQSIYDEHGREMERREERAADWWPRAEMSNYDIQSAHTGPVTITSS